MKNNSYDQFYTNPKVASLLVDELFSVFKKNSIKKIKWIEPSAGSGNFIDALKKKNSKFNVIGYDIEPYFNSSIQRADFLSLEPLYDLNNVVFGNPPFGKRSKLAIDFLNQSFAWADVVAFVLPNQFKRFLTQKKINSEAKLIKEIKINQNSFLVNNRAYNVNCVFQIWVKENRKEFKKFKNLRLIEPEPTKHPDFDTFIHNNTKQTEKYFDKAKYKWDYAIPRQGYYDYSTLLKSTSQLKKNIQYFFIKCNDSDVKKIVHKIDFVSLSETNTSIPGFSTYDFIREYVKIKKQLYD